MKKMICILLTLVSLTVIAQKNDKTFFVAKGSLNIGGAAFENAGKKIKAGGRLGYGLSLGLYHILDKNEKYYFSAHVGLNSRGYKNVRTMYIDIPITLGVALGSNKTLLLSGGAYAGFAVAGSYKNLQNRSKINFGEGTTQNRSRTDYGYVLSFTNFTELGIAFGIDFYGGLKNVVPKDRQPIDGSAKLRTTVLSMSIGIGGNK